MRRSRLIALGTIALLTACGSDPAAPAEGVPLNEASASSSLGSITIAVNAIPDGAPSAAFTTTGKKLKDFALDDNAGTTTPNSRTFSHLKTGTYVIQAGEVAGYDLVSITCVQNGTSTVSPNIPTRQVTVALTSPDAVSCSFFFAQVS